MRNPARLALRFLFLLAALTLVSALLAPSTTGRSPYLSALSDLAAGTAMAAPPCAFKACPREPGRKTPRCTKSTSPYYCVVDTTGCYRFDC